MDTDVLSGLLFGFPDFFGVRPATQTNEHDFKPRLVPLKVAEFIKELDTTNKFHIIILESHAEVWVKSQWLDSISFRNTLRPSVQESYRQANKELVLRESIKRRLALTDPSLLATFVEAVKTNSLNEQLVQAFKLQDIIAEYHK